ncbi:hypothetical protein GWO43_04195, partial [candidate division KSB1 bacterium]|nr:hypothetical protein [candidate division KSB1 bacterium]NIS23231.1 hypothetical protein [candidate division KSB1 bacterium]NIT70100.1 hypothetical protein [candidate division KSB1 bacterium]NIU23734.1 hypothetical protein [candidate division KSB1 bacterium]NIU91788.1 hypothetical protein [candidate division KSB1 bacterium]
TPMFKGWLKNKIVTIANASLNGTVELKDLSGNLLTNFQIEELSVKQDDQTIMQVDRGRVEFNPLALLARKIAIKEVILEAPKFHLTQHDATTWNVSRLLKTSQTKSKSKPKPKSRPTGTGPNWRIEAPNIRISKGQADIQTTKPSPVRVPQKIRNLDLKLGLWLDGQQVKFSLEKLNFVTQEPDL